MRASRTSRRYFGYDIFIFPAMMTLIFKDIVGAFAAWAIRFAQGVTSCCIPLWVATMICFPSPRPRLIMYTPREENDIESAHDELHTASVGFQHFPSASASYEMAIDMPSRVSRLVYLRRYLYCWQMQRNAHHAHFSRPGSLDNDDMTFDLRRYCRWCDDFFIMRV